MLNQEFKGVVIIVLRQINLDTELLFLQRSGGAFKDQWWPVAGHCEPGESPSTTARRELKEETDLDAIELIDLEKPIMHTDGKTKLKGYVAIVDKENEVKLNYEHSQFKWLTFEETYDLLQDFIHPFIKHIEEHFRTSAS